MSNKSGVTEDEFIRIFLQHGAAETSRILGIDVRNVHDRRLRIEKKTGKHLLSPTASVSRWSSQYPKRVPVNVENGIVIIGSDAHYWPDEISAAHRGLVHLTKELKPEVVILNGDAFDGARASRHPRIGWAQTPTLKAEKEAVIDRTHEIIQAHPKAKHYWTIGNHDMRYEMKLANEAPEFEGMPGFTLSDVFPLWSFCISIWINDDVVVKHRFKGGVHATHNNTVASGKSIVTGHLHSLKVTPYNDYNGIRFGIDTGTLAEPASGTIGGPQFDYNEDNPQNHRSGFIVLTFNNGRMLWPEVCHAIDKETVEFRGQIIKV